jgi:hypothetical protein
MMKGEPSLFQIPLSLLNQLSLDPLAKSHHNIRGRIKLSLRTISRRIENEKKGRKKSNALRKYGRVLTGR